MSDIARSEPVFYHAWDTNIAAAMHLFGVRTWGDVAAIPERRLLLCYNVGRRRVNWVAAKLRARGLSFADGPDDGRMESFGRIDAMSPVCGVYFAECGPFVKIGQAANIGKRIRGMALVNPYDVELVCVVPCVDRASAVACEREFHRRFHAYRHRLEWFRREGDLDAYLRGPLHAT